MPENHPQPIRDEALLRRLQHGNQAQIIAKLLHDLRNPVHSVRAVVELLSRMARPDADPTALAARAARYATPAEGAASSLVRQTERLSVYLSAPAQPLIQPVAIEEWMGETASLLQESQRKLAIVVESSLDAGMLVAADRPRLSHAVLGWFLCHAGKQAILHAAERGGRVYLGLPAAAPTDAADCFSYEELQILIENAGGECSRDAHGAPTVSFAQASAD